MRTLPLLASLLALSLLGCTHASTTPRHASSIFLVSIDGLQPKHYLEHSQDTPHLQQLAHEGIAALAAVPAYPSNTFPNHATLATGVRPAKHGVLNNTIFDPKTGPTIDWYFDSTIFPVPALWDVARKAGLTSAVFGWPVSLNAQAEWLIPEVFSPYGIDHDENWKYTEKYTNPALLARAQAISSVKRITSNEEYDQWMTDIALDIYREHRPNLTLLHLRSYDATAHSQGRDSRRSLDSLRWIDRLIGAIMKEVDREKTVLMVTGDHGFIDAAREIEINTLFVKKGWITLDQRKQPASWKVIAQSSGGQATVYLRDGSMSKAVLKVLKQHATATYRILSREKLDELQAFPDALCALDPEKGFGFGQKYDGALIRTLPSIKGEHGALPVDPDLWTGFIASGFRISKGKILKRIDLIDIAPTVARLLGTALPTAEGVPLNLTP